MRAHIWLGILLVIVAGPVTSEAGDNSVEVTYIANAGYMITAKSGSVLIDAVFDDGLGTYDRPPRSIRKKLSRATAPFDDVRLILVSHRHDDHFDAGMVAGHLANNNGAMLVAPRQVVDRLAERDDFADIEAQVKVATPETGMSVYHTRSGIDCRVVGMAHAPYYINGADKHADVENVAFIVTIDGVTLLHTGDAILDLTREFTDAAKLDEANIDILFLKPFDRSENSIDIVRNVIRPKEIVIMHIARSEGDVVLETFREIYPRVTVIEDPMDSRTFVGGE